MKLVILGDSHTVTLGLGLQLLIEDAALDAADDVRAMKVLSSPLVLDPFFDASGGEVRFLDEDARAALCDLIGHDRFTTGDADTVFAFSLGFAVQILLTWPDWRKFTSWIDDDAGRQLVSNSVIRAMALDHFRHVLEFYREVRALGLPCLAVSAPPLMQGDRWFPADVRPEVLLHFDLMMRSAVSGALARIGVPTVDTPESVHFNADRQSWRRREFGSYKGEADSVHANAEFGRLMVSRIIAAAKSLAPLAGSTPRLAAARDRR